MVPLTENTVNALKSYLVVRCPVSSEIDALFLNDRRMPLRHGPLYILFRRLCREAGVKKPRLSVCHLRHTCLTLLLQEGADLMALKKLAGHQSVRTTQVYLRVSQTQLCEAMKKHPLG
ncbi:MAG: tyrosine-type recombinase/integrase [Firmicutes bacterium]|nr:tyrosine-type recombinase/integrase [Bacillota bacterium]